jgi:hypothetical protein
VCVWGGGGEHVRVQQQVLEVWMRSELRSASQTLTIRSAVFSECRLGDITADVLLLSLSAALTVPLLLLMLLMLLMLW